MLTNWPIFEEDQIRNEGFLWLRLHSYKGGEMKSFNTMWALSEWHFRLHVNGTLGCM
jgi:hypothetical protein